MGECMHVMWWMETLWTCWIDFIPLLLPVFPPSTRALADVHYESRGMCTARVHFFDEPVPALSLVVIQPGTVISVGCCLTDRSRHSPRHTPGML